MRPTQRFIRATLGFLINGEKTTQQVAELEIYRLQAQEDYARYKSGVTEEHIKIAAERYAAHTLNWLFMYGYLARINPDMHASVERWRILEQYKAKREAGRPWKQIVSEWDPEWKAARDRFQDMVGILDKTTGQHVQRHSSLRNTDDVGIVEIEVKIRYRVGKDILEKYEPADIAAIILEETGSSKLISRGAALQNIAAEIRASILDDSQVIQVDFANRKRDS